MCSFIQVQYTVIQAARATHQIMLYSFVHTNTIEHCIITRQSANTALIIHCMLVCVWLGYGSLSSRQTSTLRNERILYNATA